MANEINDEEELISLDDLKTLEDDEISDLLKNLEEGEGNEWRFRTK